MALADQIAAFADAHGLSDDARRSLGSLLARHLLGDDFASMDVDITPVADVTDPTVEMPRQVFSAAPTPGALALPTHLEDLGLLAMGGLGEIRRVRDRKLERTMAMKVVRGDLMLYAPEVARFVEEAQATAQLQHPGIVPVHELGTLPDGRLYFTMREVRGRTLTEVWASRPPITQGVAIVLKASETVGYAHDRGVLHRDLKPDNVMVGRHGEVLVLDWGLARVRPEDAEDEYQPTEEVSVEDVARMEQPAEIGPVRTQQRAGDVATVTGAVAGTPAYMAPEQALGALEVDARVDVYALGALLYELIACRPPYVGPAALDQVRSGPPDPLPSDTSAGLVTIVDHAMARAPLHRYPDANALAVALRAWRDQEKGG